MWALRVKQKEASFYLASYPAGDLLRLVRFEKRVLPESQQAAKKHGRPPDEAERFISVVIESNDGFQRQLIKRKIHEIKSFIELSSDQPPIPGSVLLYSSEELAFRSHGGGAAGDLSVPQQPFTIIDGQHRLAGLKLYIDSYPEDADRIYVPLCIFDRRSSDFATEMFVIVNSTHSKIAKSLLIDLLERVTTASREQRVAARVMRKLYEEASSPLQYRINRLGGRSGKDKWILQAQLYNEVLRILAPPGQKRSREFVDDALWMGKLGDRPHHESQMLEKVSDRVFRTFADWYRAASRAFADGWGNPRYMITNPVTLQAITRVLGDQMSADGLVGKYLDSGLDPAVFAKPLSRAWDDDDLRHQFRETGFYERFPAKGTPERVARIHRDLGRRLG